MAGKQAKIMTKAQIRGALSFIQTTRQPERNRVMFLLSCRAGLRAVEISKVTWAMVMDATGQLSDKIELEDSATKGGKGGRTLYLEKDLLEALADLADKHPPANPGQSIIRSERGAAMRQRSVICWFSKLYENIGFYGCSSHSGRRTFGTITARKIVDAGGSLKDVQEMMGHKHLSTTQKYIDSNEDAKRKVVEMLR